MLNRRLNFMYLVHFLLFIFLFGYTTETSKKPNFIFLFVDDLSHNSVGYYGNGIVKTPNINELANNGAVFTNAHNMGGWHGAICVASRSMIISGQSLWDSQNAVTSWKSNDSVALSHTWGQLLQKGGYNTYMTGKWHVEVPAETIFQTIGQVQPGMPADNRGKTPMARIIEAYENDQETNSLFPIGYARPIDENDQRWLPTDSLQGGFWEGGTHWSEVVKNEALTFIDDAVKRDEPFFMYLSFNAPHDPRQAPAEFVDLYPIDEIPIPDNFLPEYPYKDEIGNPIWLRDESLAPFPRTPYAVKTHIREYYAIISHLDAQIGSILQALESTDAIDNTYIIFTSDHGLSVGSHGLMGKQSLYDHSIKVPFIISGPGIPEGRIIEDDIYLQDIMPTTLELADIRRPKNIFFNSLVDLIDGEMEHSPYGDGIYGAYMDHQRMIKKGKHKLIYYPRISKTLLFNLEKDSLEMNDIAHLPENKEIVNSLFHELKELQIVMNDTLNLD